MTVEVEPLSPTARLFHTPRLNCCVIATLGFNTAMNVEALKLGLEKSLSKHPLRDDNRRMRWIPTRVNIDNHVFNPEMDPNMASSDQLLEDYLSNLTKTTLYLAKPLYGSFTFLTSRHRTPMVLQLLRSITRLAMACPLSLFRWL
ncbi:hypothetical protein RJ639_001525, partial [Escallonia herrerae]